MGVGIAGWGYEGHQVEDLVAAARAANTQWIVDVRLSPVSRKRGFSKKGLSQALAEAGLKYLHLPALGNPRDNRAAFADTSGATGAAARQRFKEEVLAAPDAQDALAQVAELGLTEGVMLVCFEADPRCCHRTEVARAAAAAQFASAR
jgi:uncharacterized protein (DUF488 family)